MRWRVEGRATTVPALAEGLPCNFWSFRDCFVIFRLCYCNFNVIFLFIGFEIVFCIVDVTKKEEERKRKGKERKEKYSEKEMCGLYFVYECFFFYKIARIKKNLIF